jgi:hypothetical protein
MFLSIDLLHSVQERSKEPDHRALLVLMFPPSNLATTVARDSVNSAIQGIASIKALPRNYYYRPDLDARAIMGSPELPTDGVKKQPSSLW